MQHFTHETRTKNVKNLSHFFFRLTCMVWPTFCYLSPSVLSCHSLCSYSRRYSTISGSLLHTRWGSVTWRPFHRATCTLLYSLQTPRLYDRSVWFNRVSLLWAQWPECIFSLRLHRDIMHPGHCAHWNKSTWYHCNHPERSCLCLKPGYQTRMKHFTGRYYLNLDISFQYLEIRFQSKILRKACSATFVLQMVSEFLIHAATPIN